MEMRKGFKRSGIWILSVLSLAFLFSLAVMPAVYGAGGIETGKACAVTLKLDGQYEELDSMPIPVDLYRVASVGQDGRYTVLEGFQKVDLSKVGSETTAQVWADLAVQAAEAVQAGGIAPAAATELKAQPGQDRPSARVEGLPTGMYLVSAGTVESAEYTYDFIPYLVALPNNYYYKEPAGDDTWVYDVGSELKPEQAVRYGSIRIEKALPSYNATLGGASFVFQVEAEKDGKKVYSDVVSISFDAPGVRSLQVDGIPAGARVTVTEVYSGSAYRAVTDGPQTVTIVAEGEEGDPVPVRFENTYDPKPNSGSGIVNHFKYENGVWTPEQLKDNAGN